MIEWALLYHGSATLNSKKGWVLLFCNFGGSTLSRHSCMTDLESTSALTFCQRMACLDLDSRLMVITQVSYDLVINISVIRLRDTYTLVQSVWVCKVMWTTSALLYYGSATLNSKKACVLLFCNFGRSTLSRHWCITDLENTLSLEFCQQIACLDFSLLSSTTELESKGNDL